MNKLLTISALLLVVGCSKETNTKLLCECTISLCNPWDMSLIVNESNKLFTADFGNLTNTAFTEVDITGEYPNRNEGKWVYRVDRVSLELSKRYEANDKPRRDPVQFSETLSVYQCKIVDGI